MKTIYIKFALIALALVTNPLVVAAPTTLICKMERPSEVSLSVILEEPTGTVTINGRTFADAKYEPFRISYCAIDAAQRRLKQVQCVQSISMAT